ncbi:MAG TPA: glycosyltransferase family 39 protein [Phycisphaerales bacterium]|nr:glycosyltransferase family 39 protein [Phycisphaerales bacterium]
MLRRLLADRRTHLPAVALVCLCVYWPLLGVSGLALTEGHRAIPGWTMLETGRWWPPVLFEQVYLRKPPGMPWAVAASSALLGPTEFAARAVSALAATLMALVAAAFTRRWIGPRWGLAGGLAQALMPLFFAPGRSAEIEALNCLGTQLAALALVDALVFARVRGRPGHGTIVLFALGLVVAGLAKGPAAAPVLVATLLAAGWCAAPGSLAAGGRLALGLLIAGGCLFPVAREMLQHARAADAVVQSPSVFLWRGGKVSDVLTLAPAALVASLPASLALPWGWRRFGAWRRGAGRRRAALRALCLGWGLSLLLLTLGGVDNPRYAMPAAVLLPPLAAGAVRALVLRARARPGPQGTTLRRLPVASGLALFLVLVALIYPSERRRERISGRAGGIALAAALEKDAEIWASDLVEARPEVLESARRAAGRRGVALRPVWRRTELAAGLVPPPGTLLALRRDAGSTEAERYESAIATGALRLVTSGGVHKFRFEVYRAR